MHRIKDQIGMRKGTTGTTATQRDTCVHCGRGEINYKTIIIFIII